MSTKIDDLLKIAAGFGASDLHLKAGSFPLCASAANCAQ
jgi:Tfp pilus assembly pilus retraction ATPase PilT